MRRALTGTCSVFSLLALLGFAAVPACHSNSRPSSLNEIRVQLVSEPVTLDPALAEDDSAMKVLSNVMDGLVGYDGSGKLVNRLAAKIQLADGGRRYEFTLKPLARWSDGRPVTAHDFVVGIRRSLDPRTGARLANMLFPIRGARAFYAGKVPASALGVSEKDGRLVVELEKPTGYFLHALTMTQAAPIREDILAAHGGHWPADAPSTGPYVIAEHLADREIRLKPNPYFWDPARKRVPVRFEILPQDSTAVSLFESGDLDVLDRVPPLDIERFRARGLVHEFPQVTTYFVSFNTRKPPFNDREFRRAVAGAIDRAGIVAALGTHSLPARSWVPPGMEGYLPFEDPRPEFQASVDRIRARLVKGSVPTVTMAFNSSDVNSTIVEKIQSDLQTRLGLRIELTNMDWKTYVSTIHRDAPQMYRYGRGAPFADPIWHLETFKSDDANNPTGWKNAEYDRLVDEIAGLPSGPERLKKVLRAERILTEEDAVVIPIFDSVETVLVSPRISGLRVNPVGAVPYEEVSIKPARSR